MTDKLCFLICDNFQAEAKAVLSEENQEKIKLAAYAPHCFGKNLKWSALLGSLKSEMLENTEICLIGGSCLDSLELPDHSSPRIHIHRYQSCFELLIGKDLTEHLIQRDAYLLTPGWLERWREYLDEWGFDRISGREFFSESANKLLLLDSGIYPNSVEKLKSFAKEIALPYEIFPIGLSHFRLLLKNFIFKHKLHKQDEISRKSISYANRQYSDCAMALDLIGNLTGLMSENQVVENIFNLFDSLFAPETIYFITGDHEASSSIRSFPPGKSPKKEILTLLEKFTGDQIYLDTKDGFIIKVAQEKSLLGYVFIEGFSLPDQKERYLNITLNFISVLNLALYNASNYKKLIETQGALKEERDRIQMYLDVAGVIFLLLDSEQQVMLINSTGCKILETNEKNILNENWFDNFVPKQIVANLKQDFNKYISEESAPLDYYEYPILTKSGKQKIISWHSTILRDNSGKVTGLLSSGRDITLRKDAEEALKESEATARALLNSPTDAVLLLDPTGYIIDANQETCRRLNTSLDELKGKLILDFFPEEVANLRKQKIQEVLHTGKAVRWEDERQGMWNDNVFYPIKDKKNQISKIALFAHDISVGKKTEKQLERLIKEKEILIKEIHHRVKNNFNVISSLLNLQSTHIMDMEAKKIFMQSRDRIHSLALIHERLYQAQDMSHIDFSSYLKGLASDLLLSYGIDRDKIALNIRTGKVHMDIEKVIPCGLIANELITNSIKYAFPPKWEGHPEIMIKLRLLSQKKAALIISDNGIGLPVEIDIKKTESLGLSLVTMLAEDQLQGTIEVKRDKGTQFTLHFSL